MRKFIWPRTLVPASIIIGLSFSFSFAAQAGSQYRYIKTALPAKQKEVFTLLNPPEKKKIKAIVDQNATQEQTPPPAVVMIKINEDEIPKMAITELRSSTLTHMLTGHKQTATLKLKDGVVVAIMDKNGWEVAHAVGSKQIVSAETGAIYSFTRGKLRRRIKTKRSVKRISFKKCMKKRSCRTSYQRIRKQLKKSRYIPTRLRAKRCMQKRKCRNAVQRILRKSRTKHCYIPTKGRKICKVKSK